MYGQPAMSMNAKVRQPPVLLNTLPSVLLDTLCTLSMLLLGCVAVPTYPIGLPAPRHWPGACQPIAGKVQAATLQHIANVCLSGLCWPLKALLYAIAVQQQIFSGKQ